MREWPWHWADATYPAKGGNSESSLTGSEGGTRLNFLGCCILCKVQVSGIG